MSNELTLEEVKINVEGLIANYQKRVDEVDQKNAELQEEAVEYAKRAAEIQAEIDANNEEKDVNQTFINKLKLTIGAE